MDDGEVLEVLREIRDEARLMNARLESLEGRVDLTNARLESLEGRVDLTNSRLESLEGRVDFLEKRTSRGLEELSTRVGDHNDRIDAIMRRQADSEIRLASEVIALADVTRQVRDLLSTRLDDHAMIVDHEGRLKVMEDRITDGHEDD